jgi:hypothetical protein
LRLECTHLDVSIILEFIIPKYASFTTRPLHSALHTLFRALNTVSKERFLSAVVRQLDIVINRSNIKVNAPSNYFTLLDWVNLVLVLSAEEVLNFTTYVSDLVIWQAILLHHCIAEGKKGLTVSAIRGTRASLRGVFYQRDHPSFGGKAVESFIKILIGAKIPSFAAAIALGVVAGVCRRLRDPNPGRVIESSKSEYYDFFIKEIIGSKSRLPDYVLVYLFQLQDTC